MSINLTYDDEQPKNAPVGLPDTLHLPKDNKEAKAAAWEASKTKPTEEPITEEDVSGKEAVVKVKALPDRALVAPELKKFLASRKEQEVNPVVVQAQKIEQALQQIQQPATEPLTAEELILQKIEAMEQRELERNQREAEANAQAAYEKEINEYRERITKSIEDQPEKYPAILALERTEAVVNELLAALQNDEDTSEEEIASNIESGLWEVYNLMNAAKKPSQASDKPSTKTEPSPTLEAAPQTGDDFGIHKYSNKKAQQEALWKKHMSAEG